MRFEERILASAMMAAFPALLVSATAPFAAGVLISFMATYTISFIAISMLMELGHNAAQSPRRNHHHTVYPPSNEGCNVEHHHYHGHASTPAYDARRGRGGSYLGRSRIVRCTEPASERPAEYTQSPLSRAATGRGRALQEVSTQQQAPAQSRLSGDAIIRGRAAQPCTTTPPQAPAQSGLSGDAIIRGRAAQPCTTTPPQAPAQSRLSGDAITRANESASSNTARSGLSGEVLIRTRRR